MSRQSCLCVDPLLPSAGNWNPAQGLSLGHKLKQTQLTPLTPSPSLAVFTVKRHPWAQKRATQQMECSDRGKLDLSRQNLPLSAALSSPTPQR